MWSHLSWSPDGRRIAFTRRLRDHVDHQPGDAGGIAVVNVDGLGFVQLTFNDEDKYPAWSPDGSRIAFVRGGDIYLITSDGTGITPLTNDGKSHDPAWSPDGAKIAFVSTRNSERTTFMDSTFRTSELYVMDADGSNERLVRSEKNEAICDPDWVVGRDTD
jgi:Tol biopolymer transport system component